MIVGALNVDSHPFRTSDAAPYGPIPVCSFRSLHLAKYFCGGSLCIWGGGGRTVKEVCDIERWRDDAREEIEWPGTDEFVNGVGSAAYGEEIEAPEQSS